MAKSEGSENLPQVSVVLEYLILAAVIFTLKQKTTWKEIGVTLNLSYV